MKLLLKRLLKTNTTTIGELYIDNVYQCDTLEDKVRTKGDKKVYGETAIPEGIYEVKITYSPKFKQMMPLLLNVPGFEGIRIHPGNTNKDTLGCVLVGIWDGKSERITNSKVTYNKLFDILNNCKEPIQIEIKNI